MENTTQCRKLMILRQNGFQLRQALLLCLCLIVAVSLIGATGTTPDIQRPLQGEPVHMIRKRKIQVPGDTHVFARTGFDLLVIPRGEYDETTKEWRTHLAVIREERLQHLTGQWNISMTGAEPRSPLGDSDPFVNIEILGFGGYGSEVTKAMTLRDLLAGKAENAAIVLPTGLHSPLAFKVGNQMLATGYTFNARAGSAATLNLRKSGLGGQNLAIYNVSGTKPVLLGMIESFSDHAENNLSAGVTADGIVHLIATQVFIREGNHSWVHQITPDKYEAWYNRGAIHKIQILRNIKAGNTDLARTAWNEVIVSASHLDSDDRQEMLSTGLLEIAEHGQFELVRDLIIESSLQEELFPLYRAIEYLLAGDEALIEKLSPEIRSVVEEIVEKLSKVASGKSVNKSRPGKKKTSSRRRKKGL